MGLISIDLLEDVGAEKLVLDAASSAVLLRRCLLSALVEELTEPAKRNIYYRTLSPVPHCAYNSIKNHKADVIVLLCTNETFLIDLIVTCSWGQTWVVHQAWQGTAPRPT